MSTQLEPDREAAEDALATARSSRPRFKTQRPGDALAARFAGCKSGEPPKDCQDRRNAGYHTG